jgi:hypothetical protein
MRLWSLWWPVRTCPEAWVSRASLPVKPSGFISPRGCVRFFAGLMMVSAAAFGAAADDRAAYLREQIGTLEGVVNATKTPAEKARLDEPLERRRRELVLLEERQQLEIRERELQAARPKGTLDLLREKLRGIHPTAGEAEKRIEQIFTRRQQAVIERDALEEQVAASRGAVAGGSTSAQVQLQ